MKKYFYIFLFCLQTFLIASLLQAIIQLFLLNTVSINNDSPFSDFVWFNWTLIDISLRFALLIISIWLGIRYGKKFWQILYVEEKYGKPIW